MMRIFAMIIAIVAISAGLWIAIQGLLFPIPPHAVHAPEQISVGDIRGLLAEMPLRSDLWIALSEAVSDKSAKPQEDGLLEMAYLTGGENAEDIRPRLIRAVRSKAFSSKTIQDFVKADINLIVHQGGALKPVLAEAYEDASPDNKAIYYGLVLDADPTFVRPAEE